MTTTTKKPWFQIEQPMLKDTVEYSTSFNFFCRHQSRLVRSGSKYTFCSRLESKSFRTEKAIFGNHEFSPEQIISKWKEIHEEILAGKHGTGKFVD